MSDRQRDTPDDDDSDENIPEAPSTDYTHACCPHCEEECEFEGDVRGQVVECDACGGKMRPK
jgi:uncharacterized protein (DUF983 family)